MSNPSGSASDETDHQIVIVGAGFAVLAVARGLAGNRCRVTVIDKRNFHLFQPLLYQVATGALSPAQITTPIRAKLKKAGNITVLRGEVVAVDVTARRVTLADGVVISYDTLVLAPGMQTQYFRHPEWETLAPGLKTIEDALTIRRHILAAFERAEAREAPAE